MKLVLQEQYIKMIYKNDLHCSKSATLSRLEFTEAATRGALCKKVFLEISQSSQENTCARVSFLIKLQAFPCISESCIEIKLS